MQNVDRFENHTFENRPLRTWAAPAIGVVLMVAFGMLGAGCQTEAAPDAPRPVTSASPGGTTAIQGGTTAMLPDSVLVPPDSATAARFEAAMAVAQAESLHRAPVGDVMQRLGLTFRGVPYLAGTLDEPPTERLVVRLDGFDCVTYVETLLAMAQGVVQRDDSYAGFARRLADLRYRDGGPVGYCGRLHYFTDWIDNNAARGHVRPVTDRLGSAVLADTIDFMGTHRSAYDRFATNDSLFACVRDMEDDLQARQTETPVRYVPQDAIGSVAASLQAGDILAFVTSIDGLDVSHTGLVYVGDDGTRGVLHASLSRGVVVSPDIQRYVQQIDTQIGIVVARPLRPNNAVPTRP